VDNGNWIDYFTIAKNTRMKKILLFVVFLFGQFMSKGQDSLKYNTSRRTEEYCEVGAFGKMFSHKVTITVDYGIDAGFFSDKRVKDENDNVVKFETLIDALNYMNSQGWEFMTAFPVSTSSGGAVYHFFLRRKLK
jgi:hypothetical protein